MHLQTWLFGFRNEVGHSGFVRCRCIRQWLLSYISHTKQIFYCTISWICNLALRSIIEHICHSTNSNPSRFYSVCFIQSTSWFERNSSGYHFALWHICNARVHVPWIGIYTCSHSEVKLSLTLFVQSNSQAWKIFVVLANEIAEMNVLHSSEENLVRAKKPKK